MWLNSCDTRAELLYMIGTSNISNQHVEGVEKTSTEHPCFGEKRC